MPGYDCYKHNRVGGMYATDEVGPLLKNIRSRMLLRTEAMWVELKV